MNAEPIRRDRATEFRQALVATANLGPYARRRPPLKLIVGSVAAFALAGALTGGAVARAATIDPTVVTAQADAASSAQFLAREQDGTLIGRPFIRSGAGTQTIDLGPQPAGATNLVEGFVCIDPGRYVGFLDSKQYEEYPNCEPDGAGGTIARPVGGGGHIVTMQAPAKARFVMWLSWAKIPVLAESAAQRAELSDGTITRDEDVAAFNRYEGCMGALGHPIDVPPTAVVPAYAVDDAADEDGSDNRCYVTEYRDVDMKWQLEVEQTDVATPSIDACLLLHEVTPAATPEARSKQIQNLDLNLDQCAWTQ